MTLRKPLAAFAAIATLVGAMAVADTAAAQYRRGGGASFSFSFGSGPAFGYGYGPGDGYAPRYGYYNGYGYGARPGRYRAVRPYYAPPRYGYRNNARYRGCGRWMWDGWRQTYVLVQGRC